MGQVRLHTKCSALNEFASGTGLLPLPEVDVVDGGHTTEDNAQSNHNTGYDGWQLVEVDECEEDYSCEKDWYWQEKAGNSQHTGMWAPLDEHVCPVESIRRPEQLDAEQELDAADEQAAQVEWYGERAHGNGHLVEGQVFLRAVGVLGARAGHAL